MIPQEKLAKKSDNEIVELILSDQEYFLCIINRYKHKLFSYIKRISNYRDEEAEDVLQNVFIKVYKNINDYDNTLKFSSWIYRITHNEVIDTFRKNKARPDTIDLDISDDKFNNLSHDFDIKKELDNSILKTKIENAISKLDIKYREIFILKFIEQKDYKEISDIIKIPKGTVASRINKSKKELQKILTE